MAPTTCRMLSTSTTSTAIRSRKPHKYRPSHVNSLRKPRNYFTDPEGDSLIGRPEFRALVEQISANLGSAVKFDSESLFALHSASESWLGSHMENVASREHNLPLLHDLELRV